MPDPADLAEPTGTDLDLESALARTYARHDELVAARAARRRRGLGAGLALVAVVAAAALIPALGGDEPASFSEGVAGDASLPPSDPAASSGPPPEVGPPAVARQVPEVLAAEPAGTGAVRLTFACAGLGDEVESLRWQWSDPASASGGTLWVHAVVAGESSDTCIAGGTGATATVTLDRPFVPGTPVEARRLP